MVCECEAKMRCVYSVPIGKNARYRVYKCLGCKKLEETVEVPASFAEDEKTKAAIQKAREDRFRFMLYLKKKGG